MKGVNKVILIGYIGTDLKVINNSNGTITCTARLATPNSYKNKSTNEKIDTTEWHNLVFFGKLAEIAQKLIIKGLLVYIEGQIKTETFSRQINDQVITSYYTKIIVQTIQLLEGSDKERSPDNSKYSYGSHSPDGDLSYDPEF